LKACDRTNWSRPPSSFFGGKEWGERDHLLLLAYQRYLDTTCPECGGYVLECRDPDNRGVYEVALDAFCYRKQALEDVTRAEKFEAEHGQLFSVRPIDESIVKRPALTIHGGEDAHTEPCGDE
jgi:hypothetical protein